PPVDASLDDIAALARTIGPRPPGSPHERRAAHYVGERLSALGIPSTTLPLKTPRGVAGPLVVPLILAVASVVVAYAVEGLGLLLGLAALLLLAAEALGPRPLARLLASAPTQSVLGLIPALRTARGAPPERLVILTAHLDSGRGGLIWRRPLVRHLRALVVAVAVAAVAIPVLQAIALTTPSRAPWLLSLIPLAVVLVALGLLTEEAIRGRPVPGANDDASGVAAVLAVGRALQRAHPRHVETWLLFTAASEAGQVGMRRFLAENQLDPERTYFIVVDAVGAGLVRYTRAEGVVWTRDSSPALVRIASDLARQHPAWGVSPYVHRLYPTDQSVALARGYQAIGVLGYDPRGG
ncbi:MAG: M28 family peptidase, partial [Thermomicrobiaceae bacterium]|nr:M28 family peptidase [Thermomicrobiaceae bacterium]